jgi:hypothetical protein
VKDALRYEIKLARLGKSSSYRIDHELLGNFSKVETGEMQVPFKVHPELACANSTLTQVVVQ